jgi:hypothetical protein
MAYPADPKDDENAIGLRLSAQRALWGNVPTTLRAASVEYRGTTVACRFIFDGAPSEDHRELLSCAATEILADHREPYTLDEEYLDVPYPAEMEHLRYLVYLRYEPPSAS